MRHPNNVDIYIVHVSPLQDNSQMFSTAGLRVPLGAGEQEIWIGELAQPGFSPSTSMTASLEASVEHSLISPVRGMVVKKKKRV